jgi:hypothetical protein
VGNVKILTVALGAGRAGFLPTFNGNPADGVGAAPNGLP